MFRSDCCVSVEKVSVLVGHESGTKNHQLCGSYQGANGQTHLGQLGAVTCLKIVTGDHVSFDIKVSETALTSDQPAGITRVAIFGFKISFQN